MAVTHEMYKQILGGETLLGRVRKQESDLIMDATFDGDIQYQVAYIYDYYHDIGDERFKLFNLHPQNDLNKTPIEIKFIRHESQSYNKDPITFWLQFRPGQECVLDYYDSVLGEKYNATWPVGCFIDIMAEDGKYNKWLVVNTANYWQNQFPTWELLKCDYVLQWIHRGQKYECPGVLQSQNSQIMRFIVETLCRKFSFAEKTNVVYQQRNRFISERSTSKVRQVSENGNRLNHLGMALICSKLAGDRKKVCLYCSY